MFINHENGSGTVPNLIKSTKISLEGWKVLDLQMISCSVPNFP